MKMRRIKPAATSQVEGAGEKEKERAKGKRNVKQEEDEDYRELPQKKHKLYGRKQRPKAQPHPKPQARRVRKEPPVYAAGSMEEKWYLEIMDKGSVSCPTCQAVGRKTIEGLKKHMENCKQEMFTCHHCGKQLHSLAGMKYHVMANHNSLPILKAGDEVDEPSERERLRTVLKRMGKLRCMREVFFPESEQPDCLKEMSLEAKGGGRVQRRSAKIAVYHLQELASAELTKEWPKRKVLQDLVPDDRKGCEAVYSSVSGLKAHLGSCTLGTFVAGKYKCLLCEKEFVSESGVKYHINSVHAEDWFVVNPTTTKSFEKLMKIKQRQQEEEKQRQQHGRRRSLRRQQQPCMEPPESQLEPKAGKEQGGNEELVGPDPEPVPAQPQKAEPAKTTHKRGRK